MVRFAAQFVQNSDGSWFCTGPGHFIGPNGAYTVTPGVTYRQGKTVKGYDIAAWLDEFSATGNSPINIQFLYPDQV